MTKVYLIPIKFINTEAIKITPRKLRKYNKLNMKILQMEGCIWTKNTNPFNLKNNKNILRKEGTILTGAWGCPRVDVCIGSNEEQYNGPYSIKAPKLSPPPPPTSILSNQVSHTLLLSLRLLPPTKSHCLCQSHSPTLSLCVHAPTRFLLITNMLP